jgi:metal-responsive CopG/Arc/MetJ family transcriptional regulator
MDMDQDRVIRTTLPQVTVSIPLTLLKRIDDTVAETGARSRSAWIVELITKELTDEAHVDERELARVS